MTLTGRQSFAIKLATGFNGGLIAGTLAEATGVVLYGLTDPTGSYIGWATLIGTFAGALLAPSPRDALFALLLACCLLSFAVPLAVNISPHAPTVIYELWFGHIGILARGAGFPLAFVFLVLAIIVTKRAGW